MTIGPYELNNVYIGDVRELSKELPDNSLSMIVTSPPYWGLRDYGVDRQIGLEDTPEEYIQTMVEIFRELRRALRLDGTLWLNLGDSYNNSNGFGRATQRWTRKGRKFGSEDKKPYKGLKPKDLIGIPWRVALALQDDGWWLRSDIIWHKPNPMPESVTDRPTKSHEYLFLLTKSPQYFYDAEAIKENSVTDPESKAAMAFGSLHGKNNTSEKAHAADLGHKWEYTPKRNKRSIWSVSTQPYSEAHFAIFPPKLIEPCILAGTSEKGNCPKCGAPWVRIVEKSPSISRQNKGYTANCGTRNDGDRPGSYQENQSKTLDWQPSCTCNVGDPIPAIVFDPFMGSGTTAQVAIKHNRNWLGFELNPDYEQLIKKRINGVQYRLI